MEWTHVYNNTKLRGTDENGVYTQCKYLKDENGENDIDATKQEILDYIEQVKQLVEATKKIQGE